MDLSIVVNGKDYHPSAEPDTPLLWVLRDLLGLTGTKYGCGVGLCGSCTVHVDGEAVQSCTLPVSAAEGKQITTIEGLAESGFRFVQDAWITENVSQCGYCQPGQIMAAAALLYQNPRPSPSDIDNVMSGNLCRCGTYQRIRLAIERAAEGNLAQDGAAYRSSELLVGAKVLSEDDLGHTDLDLGASMPKLMPILGAIAFTQASAHSKLSRRGFLQVAVAAGTGLVIGVSLPGCRQPPDKASAPLSVATATRESLPTNVEQTLPVDPSATAIPSPASVDTATPSTSPAPTETPFPTTPPTPTPEPTSFFEPNVFLAIDNNGVVTVVVHRVEMGQGARTAMPMMVAEELEVPWSSIRVVQAPGDSKYGQQQTAGSSCISDTYGPLRLAGAQAREMLIMAAAQIWDVDPDTCYAENGSVIHQPSGQSLPYGELVETAATLQPRRGRMKESQDFKLIGKSIGHYDNPRIVDGSALFGTDVKVPGMLYAAVARNPELRGGVADYDASSAEKVSGVRHVVPIESGVAVVADNTWAALQGKRAINLTLDSGGYAELNSEAVRRTFVDQLSTGTVETNILQSIYAISFLAHATPSPMNCAADIRADSFDVWAPTQTPQGAKSMATRRAGLRTEDGVLHVPRVGGGFGRRLQVDYVRDAVDISRALGAPIQVLWSREDDIQHDYYHPLSVHRVNSDLTSPSLPRIQSRTYGQWDQITGAWRAVSNFTEGFVRECFLDEMAIELKIDPLEIRLDLLGRSFHPTLEAATEMAGWGDPLPDGRSRGIAAYSTWGVTPVVMIAEVSIDNGAVRVHRVVTALDCGTAINPDMVKAQMEGGIAWGLSALLGNEITIQDGQVQQSNFHDYPILRFNQMPVVETIIIPSTLQPRGVGEMGVPPIAPAVLNALYGLTGERIRNLPIMQDDL